MVLLLWYPAAAFAHVLTDGPSISEAALLPIGLLKMAYREVIFRLRRNTRRRMVIGATIIASVISVALLLSSHTEWRHSTITIIVVLGVEGFMNFGIIVFFTRAFVRLLWTEAKDKKFLERQDWKALTEGSASLTGTLHGFRTSTTRLQFLQEMQRRNLIGTNPAAIPTLRVFSKEMAKPRDVTFRRKLYNFFRTTAHNCWLSASEHDEIAQLIALGLAGRTNDLTDPTLLPAPS
jgi:hypothetical protein